MLSPAPFAVLSEEQAQPPTEGCGNFCTCIFIILAPVVVTCLGVGSCFSPDDTDFNVTL